MADQPLYAHPRSRWSAINTEMQERRAIAQFVGAMKNTLVPAGAFTRWQPVSVSVVEGLDLEYVVEDVSPSPQGDGAGE